METRIDEIADHIYRFSTLVPGVAGPAGLSFNQFLIDADQPLLFHTGPRGLFPLVSAAVARVTALNRLRWINFSHIEADECGALENWLAAAPQATAAHSRVGCAIWLNDVMDRPARALADDEVIDLGGKRVRHLDTPHLPHCWDAGLLYEETTGTLFCSDLFTQTGDCPALTDKDIVGRALTVEKMLPFSSTPPNAAALVRRLAALSPKVLAIMHGSSFNGDAPAALEALAAYYETRLRATV
ncbi:MAG: MBL fold metallo-hydrolase [Candidatus Binataceae bacterium]